MEATKATKSCKIEGCKKSYRAKGYCSIHFQKWRRGELKEKARFKTCGEENCKKPMYRFGICETHYQTWMTSRKPAEAAPAPAVETPAVAAVDIAPEAKTEA
ncbi:MAG: hypothetical protein Q7T03_04195 [Deltaproteobacteria bacterium]|nr:hypothetical protein [Deltaproteobacteria bacterium]